MTGESRKMKRRVGVLVLILHQHLLHLDEDSHDATDRGQARCYGQRTDAMLRTEDRHDATDTYFLDREHTLSKERKLCRDEDGCQCRLKNYTYFDFPFSAARCNGVCSSSFLLSKAALLFNSSCRKTNRLNSNSHVEQINRNSQMQVFDI